MASATSVSYTRLDVYKRQGADVQPLTGGKRREILGLKEQVGARADHKGKGALPVAIEIDHHREMCIRDRVSAGWVRIPPRVAPR